MGRQLERHTNKNHHFGLQAFLLGLDLRADRMVGSLPAGEAGT